MSAATRTLTIELPEKDAADIEQLLAGQAGDRFTSHGRLMIETLTAMLLEDAALAHRRPGLWEGAGLIDVLQRHGYDV